MKATKGYFLYIFSIAATIGLFFLIRRYGGMLQAPVPLTQPTASLSSPAGILPHLLLAIAVVMMLGRLLGAAFRYVGQPAVIGEVVGGILLGPSALGAAFPSAYEFLLPVDLVPVLGVIAQIGVLIYMFLIGLELNPDHLRQRLHATIAISHASIVLPFILGASVALYVYPQYSNSGVPFTGFALFLGLAMSITAFPVLARILSDSGIERSMLGTVALTCAAADDVTAWCLLAFVVGVVHASGGSFVVVALLTIGFVGIMLIGVRPIAARIVARLHDRVPTQTTMVLILVGLLASAWTTESIGTHAIFGAFIFGAAFPRDSKFAAALRQSLESLTILLLPLYFALTGMRTEIGLVSGVNDWLVCGLIIAVATIGKFAGASIAARLGGFSWRESSALGVLMNTRGLMELIVLNLGLELGVISPTLFTMMVLMALATTIATAPILRRLIGSSRNEVFRFAARWSP
jgi:Kef-type K+ transport system membrane component KefB